MKPLIVLLAVLLLPSCVNKTKHPQTHQFCIIDSISLEPPRHNFAVKPTFVMHTSCNTLYKVTGDNRFEIGDTIIYIEYK